MQTESLASQSRIDSIARSSGRLAEFDACRGLAMLFVCLSHFCAVYFKPEFEAGAHILPVEIAMIASPGFVGLSGMMIGILLVTSRDFDALRIKLLDRAVFMLTLGHVIVAAGRWYLAGNGVWRSTFVTDAVAVCLLVGLCIIRITTARQRIVMGAAAFAVAWTLIFDWRPNNLEAEAIKELAVGAMPNRVMGYTVPILQWFAVYLLATAFGERVGRMYQRGETGAIDRLFLRLSAYSVSLAVLLRIGSWYFRRGDPSWRFEPFFSPWTKLNVGPVYLLFFGGVALGVMGLIAATYHRGRSLSLLAMLGRTSFAAFALQSWLYYTILDAMHPTRFAAWPLLYFVSLIPVFVLAYFWDGRRLNDRLSVGLRPVFSQLLGFRSG